MGVPAIVAAMALFCSGKSTPYKVRVAFSKPAHAARARIGPHGPNYGALTGKPRSHHVHVTLQVTPPTSPVPPFLLMQNQRV